MADVHRRAQERVRDQRGSGRLLAREGDDTCPLGVERVRCDGTHHKVGPALLKDFGGLGF
jgi:hypothetical protein